MMTTRPSTESRLDLPKSKNRKNNCAAEIVTPSFCENILGRPVTSSNLFYSSTATDNSLVNSLISPAFQPVTSMVSPSRTPAASTNRSSEALLGDSQADSREITLPYPSREPAHRKHIGTERRLEGVPETQRMLSLGPPDTSTSGQWWNGGNTGGGSSSEHRISRCNTKPPSEDVTLAAIISIQTAWRRFMATRDLDLRLLTHCLMAIRRVAVVSLQRVWRGWVIRRVISEELGCVVFRWPVDEDMAEDDRRCGRLHTRQADVGKVIIAASTTGDPATRGSRAIARPRKVLCNVIQFVPDLSGRPNDQPKIADKDVTVTGNFLKQPWSDSLQLRRCRIRNCYVVAVPKARLLSRLPIDGTTGECVVIFKFLVDRRWRCNTWHFDTVKDPHGNDNNFIFLRAAVPFPPEQPHQRAQALKGRKANDKCSGLLI